MKNQLNIDFIANDDNKIELKYNSSYEQISCKKSTFLKMPPNISFLDGLGKTENSMISSIVINNAKNESILKSNSEYNNSGGKIENKNNIFKLSSMDEKKIIFKIVSTFSKKKENNNKKKPLKVKLIF